MRSTVATRTGLAAALVLVMGGVGCATGYEPVGWFEKGGYSEIQLAENVFEVRFLGNRYTDSARASDFALLRSAEVVLAHGFRFFVVTGGDDSVRTRVVANEVSLNTIQWPTTRNTIVCYRERPRDAGPSAVVLDAGMVRRSVRAKWGLGEE